MRMHLPARLAFVLAVGATLAGSAHALQPGTLLAKRPYLYATPADIAALKAQLPLVDKFPGAVGEISFTFTPHVKGAADDPRNEGTFVIANANAGADFVQLRYVKTEPGEIGENEVKLQLALAKGSTNGTGKNLAYSRVVPAGQPVQIQAKWSTGKYTVSIGGKGSIDVTWTDGANFNPGNQALRFNGHAGDQIANFTLIDGSVVKIPNKTFDLALAASWSALLAEADASIRDLDKCGNVADADAPGICLVKTGGRSETTTPARTLSLVYTITGDPKYSDAAVRHIGLINGVTDRQVGGEWAMAARVGALGLYYNWLRGPLTEQRLLEPVASTIKATIKTPSTNSKNVNDDLLHSICGPKNTLSDFKCTQEPVYESWDGVNGKSVSPQYIAGHAQTGQFGALLGLLAIYPDDATAGPLIDTIYNHFKLGFIPARNQIGMDGGYHTLFAYNGSFAADLAERLVVWRRAFGDADLLPAEGLKFSVLPYLYGTRGDRKTFPARSDTFEDPAGKSRSRILARVGMQQGLPEAAWFYQNVARADRPLNDTTYLWEELLFPPPGQEATPELQAPNSAMFKLSGNALIRNTWELEKATLLDFKSTPFISENHQHLDQNSYSLYYKAPLVVDSGQYDDYSSIHWKNYYQRTIAHNAIVFNDTSAMTDPAKTINFMSSTISRDGGQWYGNRDTYPTREQIAPGGSHALHGITRFMDGGTYVYVQGNASKAYSATRGNAWTVHQDVGALRDIVYLREPDSLDGPRPPLVLVFDQVRALVPAVSLLHSVGLPVTNTDATRTRDNENGVNIPGRYQFRESPSRFTIRNGGGMVTVDVLLPAMRKARLSGGLNFDGNLCPQFMKVKENDKDVEMESTEPSGDCRFLVRSADGQKWMNYPPFTTKPSMPADYPDIGNWRMEISDSTVAAESTQYMPQYFLNALHVADNDSQSGVAAPRHQVTRLTPAGSQTTAVLVGTDRIVVFNGAPVANATLRWTEPADFRGTVLVVGVEKSRAYVLTSSGNGITLAPAANENDGNTRATDGGTIFLTR